MASTDVAEVGVLVEAAQAPNAPARWGRSLLRFARRKPLGFISLVYILIVGTMVIFAGVFAPSGPFDVDATARLAEPGSEHWFGTDNLGRDVYSRVIYGGRTSLMVAQPR
jgi:ABC-type dipeptide/oligopeptide/nickel transport system permease subunit